MSQTRQNYHNDSEAGVNKQINLEFYAAFVYNSIAFHFDRADVSLKEFHEFFKRRADEEIQHARVLMKFQNQRGGRFIAQDIKKPQKDDWGSGLEAMEAALELEKLLNKVRHFRDLL